MRLIVAVCLLVVAFSHKPEIASGSDTEILRRDFKSKLEKSDAVVVARFTETKLVSSEVVDKTHTIHTLHSQFSTLSILAGKVADDFTLRHLRDEYRAVDKGIVINDIPKRYDFLKGTMVVLTRDDKNHEYLGAPVYFLYLRKLKDKAVKGELYEVVEVEEFIGPGVYEATNPWMSKYLKANRK